MHRERAPTAATSNPWSISLKSTISEDLSRHDKDEGARLRYLHQKLDTGILKSPRGGGPPDHDATISSTSSREGHHKQENRDQLGGNHEEASRKAFDHQTKGKYFDDKEETDKLDINFPSDDEFSRQIESPPPPSSSNSTLSFSDWLPQTEMTNGTSKPSQRQNPWESRKDATHFKNPMPFGPGIGGHVLFWLMQYYCQHWNSIGLILLDRLLKNCPRWTALGPRHFLASLTRLKV